MKKIILCAAALMVSACAGLFAGDWEPGKNYIQAEAGLAKHMAIGSASESSTLFEADAGFQHAFFDWLAVEGGLRSCFKTIDMTYTASDPGTGKEKSYDVSGSGLAFQPYGSVWFNRFHISTGYDISLIEGEVYTGTNLRLGWNPRITEVGPGTLGVDFGFALDSVEYEKCAAPFGVYLCASYNLGL